MERFYSNVGAPQSPLEQAPEILNPLRMDVSTHVLYGMVHHVVNESALQSAFIGHGIIGVNGRTELHLSENFILQGFALHVRNNRGANLTHFAVEDALHN